nr:IS3 family transposase [Aggregatibacter actinomycetemcomitans]
MLLKIIGSARSTFYYTPQAKEDHHAIRQRILDLYQANQGRDGYRMIRLKLQQEGIFLSGKTVLAHMRALDTVSRPQSQMLSRFSFLKAYGEKSLVSATSICVLFIWGFRILEVLGLYKAILRHQALFHERLFQ